MEYLRFLKAESDTLQRRFIALASLSGISNGLLISTLIAAAATPYEAKAAHVREFFIVVICFLLYILARKRILDNTSALVEAVVRKIRVRISEKLRTTELQGLEMIGKTTIMQGISQDCQIMSETARVIAMACSSAVAVAFACLFIAFISIKAFIVFVSLTGTSIYIFLRHHENMESEIMEAWQDENLYFEAVNDQLNGFNELKVNADKADDLLYNDIVVIAERSEQTKAATARKMNFVSMFGECSFYVIMAIVIFLLPGLLHEPDLPVGKIVAIILFIIGPISQVIMATPMVAKANVATMQIKNLEAKLDEAGGTPASEDLMISGFETLRCEDLVFRYPASETRRPFQVGPIDLEVKRGEIVFIVGGNGTGKSTLLKLLSGLFSPLEGHIALNGKQVTPSRMASYRSHISIILQDFHLFRRLLGVDQVDHGRTDDLLSMLRIGGVTGVDANGKFTNLSLSTGQKKRLALLVLELEDREIYIFDEWAADQDPEFRKHFYEVYLPSLRVRGKTVIAATHDDHFFHIADRILKMDEGRLYPMEGDTLTPRKSTDG